MTSFHNRARRQEFPQQLLRRSINSRAQVTIFIILGIVIVVGIVIFFIISNKSIEEVNTPEKLGPKGFIDSCVQDAVEDSLEKILANGGVLEPSKTLLYNGTNYTYLCYAGDYYQQCYTLYPMLKQNIANQIKSNTTKDVQDCFQRLREDFENRGYDVIGNETYYDIEIRPGEIRINLEKSIKIGIDGDAQLFENFDSKINYPIYELLDMTEKIITQESKNCGFDVVTGSILYEDKDIEVHAHKKSKIYSVEDRDTGIKTQFATRSCVYPTGLY